MLLTTEGLSKQYRRGAVVVDALKDISLEVEERAFVTVTGPSGSGKTTLLLTLAGLLRPSSGTVTFRGQPLASLTDAQWAEFRSKNLGFVMQNFSLVPYLSAAENVALPLAVAKVSGLEQRKKAASMLERVGLSDRANHLPRELSAGQQQRVAIARALASSPSLVLADEPTGNLDPLLAREVLGLLKRLNKEDKMSILMVTHSPEAAEAGTARLHLESGQVASARGAVRYGRTARPAVEASEPA
jgi:putative ABC transport system ATP-binding protein